MPSLKQLKCTIEKGADNSPLNEFGTRYYDGAVETFVRVPPKPINFSVHLTSKGYIAPGLAMFVFMDGISQCNRNRRGLVIPDNADASADAEVDFRVRQKEDKLENSKFIGREWSFEQLSTAAANRTTKVDRDVLSGIGTIEVVVLRCHGEVQLAANTKNVASRGKSAHVVVDVGGLDGAMDLDASLEPRLSPFGLDGYYDTKEYRLPADVRREHGWDPTPQRPETPEHLKRRGSQRNALVGLDQAFQRHGIGATTAQLDGGRSAAGGLAYHPHHPWPTSAALGAYPYPPQWGYPPWHLPLQPPPGFVTTPARPVKSKVQPLWANLPTSNAGKERRGPKATNRASSPVSPAKDNDWAADNNRQNDAGQNDWDDKNNLNQAGKKDDQGWDNDAGKDDNNAQGGDSWGDDAAHKDDWNKEEKIGGNDWDDQNKKSGGDGNFDNTGGQQATNDTGNAHQQDNTWGNNETGKNDCNNNNGAEPRPEKVQRKTSNSSLQRAASDGAFDPNKSHVKPYWTKWNRRVFAENDDSGKDPYIVPEEPLPAVPESLAQKENMSHQIRAGRGKLYYHSTGTPKYIDTMENPYAVFIFKYRSKEALQKIFPGLKIKTDVIPIQERWKTMTEDERLAYVLELQADISDGEATNDDGEDPSDHDTTHSRSTTRTKKSNRSKKGKAADDGWGSNSVKHDKPSKKANKSKDVNDWDDAKGKKKSGAVGGNEWETAGETKNEWDDDKGKKKSEGAGSNEWETGGGETKNEWNADAGAATKTGGDQDW